MTNAIVGQHNRVRHHGEPNMKAVVVHAAKDLRGEEREAPSLGPGQVRVRMASGGICGSDLHYYNHGGFGMVRLKQPMILGHEAPLSRCNRSRTL